MGRAIPGGGKGIGTLVATLALDTTQFYSGMAGVSTVMKNLGKSLTTFVTLPLLAVGAVAVKSAMDFETSFAKMQGLAGVAAGEIAGLKENVMALSQEMGRPPQELADALYFIRSSGFAGAEALDVLRISAIAARTGLGTTRVVADLLTTVLNAYGHANISAAEATNILTAAVRLGKGEPEAFAAHLGYVVPIAAEMGLEFNEVAAAIAAMSRKMSSSDISTAVVNLRQVLSDLLSPAEHSRAALKAWGTSAQELRKIIREDGLLRALEFVNSKMKDNDEAFSEIFGNVRSLTGALSLAGVSANGVAEVFEDMRNNVGELDRALKVVSDTSQDKFNRAMASLQVAGIELGAQLMPIFLQLVDLVKQAATWYTELTTEGQKSVIMLLAFAAALGPALLIMNALIGVIAGIATPIGAAIIAIGALAVSFIYLYENWQAVVERISDWTWWKNMINSIVNYGISMWNTLMMEWFTLLNKVIDAYNVIAFNSKGILAPLTRFNWADVLTRSITLLETETKVYEHQFKGFTDSIISWAKKAGLAIEEYLFPSTGPKADYSGDPGEGPLNDFDTRESKAPFRPGVWKIGEAEVQKMKKAVVDLDTAMKTMIYNTLDDLEKAFTDIFSGDFSGKSFFEGLLATVGAFTSAFAKQLILAGVAALAFRDLLINPVVGIAAGIALLAASAAIKAHLKKGPVQGLASGGFVTQGGVFQLHRDELVNLPRGSAVTPARMATGGGGGSIKIAMRQLVIELRKEEARMNR